mmetsp:Transcript_80634/g.261285  ORF Transcript_80634/g.261285 Transcript_80634/m.261285 type:complete len:246 (+) Transcript_80634:201-938(+)
MPNITGGTSFPWPMPSGAAPGSKGSGWFMSCGCSCRSRGSSSTSATAVGAGASMSSSSCNPPVRLWDSPGRRAITKWPRRQRTGQLIVWRSHPTTQSVWKRCPQGRRTTLSSPSKLSRQMEHSLKCHVLPAALSLSSAYLKGLISSTSGKMAWWPRRQAWIARAVQSTTIATFGVAPPAMYRTRRAMCSVGCSRYRTADTALVKPKKQRLATYCMKRLLTRSGMSPMSSVFKPARKKARSLARPR